MLGDGFGCVDLDDCFVGGELSLLARTVVSRNRGAFVEVSRSGCGLHVFGRLVEGAAVVERGFEVYSRGRFMWVTGDVFVRRRAVRPRIGPGKSRCAPLVSNVWI